MRSVIGQCRFLQEFRSIWRPAINATCAPKQSSYKLPPFMDNIDARISNALAD
jgi:hypothetical protein